MWTDPVTGEKREGIARVRYSAEAMADLVIADPSISQNTIAAHFGYTPGWISRIFNSDAFKAYLHQRKEELTDPDLKARVNARLMELEEQLKTVADLALNRMIERLAGPLPVDDDFLLKSAQMAKDALGYGARGAGAGPTNINVVVQVPSKAKSTAEWSSRYMGDVEVVPPALPD